MDAIIDPKLCPACGDRMVVTASRKVGRFRRKYRTCPGCERRDTILVEPERVTQMRVVQVWTLPAVTPHPDALN